MKLRATRALKARQRWTIPENRYSTRRLMAGDEFEASDADARVLKKAKWAEEPPKRGRPPKASAPEPTPEPVAEEPQSKALADHTVAELREMAMARGLTLPDGYVMKDELIGMLEGGADT